MPLLNLKLVPLYPRIEDTNDDNPPGFGISADNTPAFGANSAKEQEAAKHHSFD